LARGESLAEAADRLAFVEEIRRDEDERFDV
jgi:hypothetical protein